MPLWANPPPAPGAFNDTLPARLQAVEARLAAAVLSAARPPGSVTLVAVSKTFPAAVIRAAHAAGQRHFAENYLQEALDKIEALADLDIVWHFIGPIQSNKTRPIAERFQWVHSVDRLRIAQRLSDQRPAGLPALQLCLQVNVSGEASKSGVAPGEVPELVASIGDLPGVQLRGLMTIPEPTDDPALQRLRFSTLRALLPSGTSHGQALDTLSMGMSDDLEAAILEGATMVRVGRAIFGDRTA
jgi:pyridoxal phosphate enzyme (YggS family)